MDKFFSEAATKSKQKAPQEEEEKKKTTAGQDAPPKKLPKGVVLGKDGKPCRSCTSFADWAAMTAQTIPPSSSSTPSPLPTTTPDCPPDIALLGRSTWTLLHTISATYPPHATPSQQSEMRQFLHLFGKLYPCWTCAEDFQQWMRRKGNEPRVEGREGLGRWMCEAHNEVNVKLGKGVWDCGRWEERWGGKADPRCG